MTCRYRFVFAGGRIESGEKVGNPILMERAARLAGALGVTVVVLP
jgi:hypothetical protein